MRISYILLFVTSIFCNNLFSADINNSKLKVFTNTLSRLLESYDFISKKVLDQMDVKKITCALAGYMVAGVVWYIYNINRYDKEHQKELKDLPDFRIIRKGIIPKLIALDSDFHDNFMKLLRDYKTYDHASDIIFSFDRAKFKKRIELNILIEKFKSIFRILHTNPLVLCACISVLPNITLNKNFIKYLAKIYFPIHFIMEYYCMPTSFIFNIIRSILRQTPELLMQELDNWQIEVSRPKHFAMLILCCIAVNRWTDGVKNLVK